MRNPFSPRNLEPTLAASAVVFLVAAFPLQVLVASKWPALVPYAFLGGAIALAARRAGAGPSLRLDAISPAVLLVGIYLLLVLVNTGWQVAGGVIEVAQGASALVNFALPAAFFYYYRRATAVAIRAALRASAVMGIVVGAYFAYDSYHMLILGTLNDYAVMAHQYSVDAAGDGALVNAARVTAGERSHGLLELHAVSAAWVAIGCFAGLALMRTGSGFRTPVVVAFGLILIAAQNYTAMAAFALVVVLTEFEAHRLVRGLLSRRLLRLAAAAVAAALLAGPIYASIGGEWLASVAEAIAKVMDYQLRLAGGAVDYGVTGSYFGDFLLRLLSFPSDVADNPHVFFVGDGFAGYGINKGGDFGLVESMHRFGLPFFLAALFGLPRLAWSATIASADAGRHAHGVDAGRHAAGMFAAQVIFYILVNEIHYSVWSAKAVLPMFFAAVALATRRPLPVPPRRPCSAPAVGSSPAS